jgi:hypothetical protein
MVKHRARRGESGNALFYIFAAIALLAALTYAVSHSGRTSVSDLTKDRVRLLAGEVISYGDSVAKGTAMLRLRGIPATSIDLDNSVLTGYDNAACTTADCAVFDPDGGGVNYVIPPTDWLDSSFSGQGDYGQAYFDGHSCVPLVGSGHTDCDSDSTDNEELVMFVPFVRKQLCTQINDLLSVGNPGGDAPVVSDCAFGTKFTGSFGDGTAIDAPELAGKTAGCFRYDGGCGGAGGSYHFYQVLIAR